MLSGSRQSPGVPALAGFIIPEPDWGRWYLRKDYKIVSTFDQRCDEVNAKGKHQSDQTRAHEIVADTEAGRGYENPP